jgi:hypothetical protein
MKRNIMTQLLASLAVSVAILSGSTITAHAMEQAMLAGRPVSARAAFQLVEASSTPAIEPSEDAVTGATVIRPNGLCCTGVPVIPLGTPMREPIVPTAPGMPGQSAPIGTTSTLPPGQ